MSTFGNTGSSPSGVEPPPARRIPSRPAQGRHYLIGFGDAEYARLLGETGRLLEIEDFGKVLSEGRVLED